MQAVEKRISLFNSIAQSVITNHDANFWLQKINPLWSVNQSLAKLVRPASVEDIVLNAHLEEIADKALNRCTAWLESQHNAAVLTAIEPLLDCKTVYFHFLGVDCGEWELSQLLRYYEMELGEDDFVKRVMTGCGPNCGSGGCGSAQTGCVGCALKNRAVTRSKVLH